MRKSGGVRSSKATNEDGAGAHFLPSGTSSPARPSFGHLFGGDGSPGDHVLCYCSDLQMLPCNPYIIFTPPGTSQLCMRILLRKIKTVKKNLLIFYCMTGMILGTEDRKVNK